MDPVILFFLLGAIAGLLRADLRLPLPIYEFATIMLLLAIGLKGGVELAKESFWDLAPVLVVVIAMGAVLTLIAFPVLRLLGRFKRADAASIAAHYGSVSVGTFAVAIAYLNAKGVTYEAYAPVLVVVLEVPAIVVGILLARGVSRTTRWRSLSHEMLLGRGVLLLTGGLAIGWIAGEDNLAPITPFFFDLFKGILALFLLEMGLVVAKQMGMLRKTGLFLVAFGVLMPLVSAVIGTALGVLLGMSVGGVMILATLAASASYIAVPAAMRLSLPEAEPTLSLAASLGVTFPFNVIVGVPLYFSLAQWATGLAG